MSFPKLLGTCVDNLYKLKEEIAEESRRLKKLESKKNKLQVKFKELEDHIFESVTKQKLEGSQGKLARVTVKKSVVPTLKDRKKLLKFIIKEDAPELIGSISSPAWRHYLEEGKKVSGVDTFNKLSLSLNKV